uniref:Uncharacterized protein n=1 Tax=Arundo donax TaxID=35708 RepID=A0A0A9D4N1_ARUDO
MSLIFPINELTVIWGALFNYLC